MSQNKHTVWGKIPGYTNYLVSIDGQVLSKSRITKLGNGYGQRIERQKILKQSKRGRYPSVPLGKGNQANIHRLVAITFMVKPKYKDLVLHRDDNGFNNLYENLYWGDNIDNARDAISNGYVPKVSRLAIDNSAKARRTKVVCYNDKEILEFESKSEAAKHFNIVNSSISNALKNGTTIGSKINGMKGTHYVRPA